MYDYNARLANSSYATLLNRIKNDPMREYCTEFDMPVPYFEKHDSADFNKYIASKIKVYSKEKLRPGLDVEGKPRLNKASIRCLMALYTLEIYRLI